MTAIVDLAGADNRDGLSLLLAVLPASVKSKLDLYPNLDTAIEIVMDLGRCAEIRFSDKSEYITDVPIDRLDLEDCVSKLGSFSGDNRAGIERTLHRISCIRNRNSEIIGLTCRVGRSITGAADKVRDLLATGKSILLLGRPGVGKSTTLREIARILSDDLGKRVVIIDSSNEIAGDGDIPHAAIGRARRMQVARPELQHHVMIEAVENHTPQVIIIDEIGTELEAIAARTIAERGVQLIGTAHGNYLENLLKNPTLSDLIGGIGAVTLGDDEARKRGTQKTVLERKAPPTFDIAVEMHQRDRWVVHESVSDVVDTMLRGRQPTTQVRTIDELGNLVIRNELPPVAKNGLMPNPTLPPVVAKQLLPLTLPVPAFVPATSFKQGSVPITIYCHDLDLAPVTKLIAALNLPISITKRIDVADAILTLRQHTKNDFKLRAIGELHNIPIYSAKSGTISQLTSTLNRMVG